jgi:peptidoglycan/LPS O-acetylase OafA/YrhL
MSTASLRGVGGASAADASAGAPAAPRLLPSLTGLRAVAALIIFLAHVNVFLPIPHTPQILELGGVGVPYFFILSGFVLAWSFSDRDSATWFYARRFSRIWPLMALCAVVATFIMLEYSTGVNRGETLWLGLSMALLINSWFQNGILNSPNPVSWPVSVEVFCYALFPFLVRPAVRRSLKPLLALAVFLVLLGWGIRVYLWTRYPTWQMLTPTSASRYVYGTMSPPARLHEFLLGVVAAVAVRKGWRPPVRAWMVSALLLCALVVLYLFHNASWRSNTLFDPMDPITAPLIALLITTIAARDLDGRRSWLGSRPMVRLGNWSYAFFLFHFLVLYVVAKAVYHFNGMTDFYRHIQQRTSNIGWVALAFAISVAVAGLAHELYEHPIDQRLRRMFRRILNRPRQPVLPTREVPDTP